MGTTLTGTTPQDTYDSLIKVTDNGPLGPTTAKYLSDGLGNDSVLALSQAAVGIGTTNPLNPLFVSASNAGDYAAFIENTNSSNGYGLVARTAHTGASGYAFAARAGATDIFVVRADGHVGIGTGAPASTLDVSGTLAVSGASTSAGLILSTDDTILATDGSVSRHSTVGLTLKAVAGVVFNFSVYSEDDNALIVNPTGTNNIGFVSGNVGIGTSAPNTQLEVSIAASVGGVLRLNNARTTLFDGDVNGSIQFSNNEATAGASGVRSEITSLLRDVSGKTDVVFTTAGSGVAATEKLRILADGGITFNGDTAAANALDDYEEGTFTATLKGSVSDPSTAVTTTGGYTKVGDVVSLRIAFASVDTTGASGDVSIIGLPFTASGIAAGSAVANLFNFGGKTSIASYVNNSTSLSVFGSVDGGTFGDLQHSAGAGRWLVCNLTYFV